MALYVRDGITLRVLNGTFAIFEDGDPDPILYECSVVSREELPNRAIMEDIRESVDDGTCELKGGWFAMWMHGDISDHDRAALGPHRLEQEFVHYGSWIAGIDERDALDAAWADYVGAAHEPLAPGQVLPAGSVDPTAPGMDEATLARLRSSH